MKLQKIPFYVFANSIVSSEKLSGGDRIFIELSKRLDQKWDLHIVTSKVGWKLCKRHNLNAHYHLVPCTYSWEDHRSSSLGLAKVFIKRIAKACAMTPRINAKSIIYSSSDILTDTLPAFLMKSKNTGSKWVAALYLIAPPPWKGYKKGYVSGFSLPDLGGVLYFLSQTLSVALMKDHADLILVLNKIDKLMLTCRGVESDKILVISGGVDIKNISKIPFGSQKYDASFVGRFHPQKGVFDLIKIWKHVCQNKEDAKLAVIGSGDERVEDAIATAITKEGLQKNIFLLGFIDGEEKFKVLRSSKIFLFPSTYESWGLVACEAMACGLPVVAYDLPIFKEIFGHSIITVPIGDVKKFSEAIFDLLQDEKKRERVARLSMETALNYDWDTIARKVSDRIKGFL